MGVGAAIGIAGGLAKGIMGASQARKARKALDRYQRQELTNVFEDVSVSTLGAKLQREELARATATGVSALQQSGVRGLIGGIGALQQGSIQQSRQIAADLDIQQQQIDVQRAQDQARIRQMQEAREQQDIAGLGQQLAVGQQNIFGGIADITQGAFALAGGAQQGGQGDALGGTGF